MAYGLSNKEYIAEKDDFYRTLNKLKPLIIRSYIKSRNLQRSLKLYIKAMEVREAILRKYHNDDFIVDDFVTEVCIEKINNDYRKDCLIKCLGTIVPWQSFCAKQDRLRKKAADECHNESENVSNMKSLILEEAKTESDNVIMVLKRKLLGYRLINNLILFIDNNEIIDELDDFYRIIEYKYISPNERAESIIMWINEISTEFDKECDNILALYGNVDLA